MSNLKSLKKSLDDLSSKQNVISQEALFAKAVTEEDALQRKEEEIARIEKQAQLMQEFNKSIALLMRIFKESNFDSILGIAAAPARLLVVNFFIALIKGIGFALGALITVALVASYFPAFFN